MTQFKHVCLKKEGRKKKGRGRKEEKARGPGEGKKEERQHGGVLRKSQELFIDTQ